MSDEYLLNIDKIYYFLIKKCSFTCVCAFFVVPLQPHSVKSAPLAHEARWGPRLGKPVKFWHRPAAVICNIVCIVSKSLVTVN